jgi:hypothetical protein
MRRWLKRNLAALITALSAILLAFLGGMTVGHLRLGPDVLVSRAIAAIDDLKENGQAYFLGKPVGHLRPLRFERTGIVVADAARAAPGVTFVTGLFGNRLGARLYGPDGTLLYEWPTNFFEVAPDEMAFPFDALIHGDALYPDGDLVVNLDGRGLMRVSACGEIRWQNRDRSHHAIFIDEAGFIWTPTSAPEYHEPRLLGEPFRFDRVAKFDPANGRKVDEIDLVEVLVEAEAQGLALSNRPKPEDMMHLNDVEVLSSAMAGRFPGFAAGDIMLSSRQFNQLWVLDGQSHALKWWQAGPMVGQHDPDFQPDGTITLFDNRPSGDASPENGYRSDLGGSRILALDPQTRAYRTLYASSERDVFYSPYRGKHQMLANGNILITETDAGRAFEVTPQGDIVWSFVNGWDEDEVGWVMSATRYPPDHAAIGRTVCPSA